MSYYTYPNPNTTKTDFMNIQCIRVYSNFYYEKKEKGNHFGAEPILKTNKFIYCRSNKQIKLQNVLYQSSQSTIIKMQQFINQSINILSINLYIQTRSTLLRRIKKIKQDFNLYINENWMSALDKSERPLHAVELCVLKNILFYFCSCCCSCSCNDCPSWGIHKHITYCR